MPTSTTISDTGFDPTFGLIQFVDFSDLGLAGTKFKLNNFGNTESKCPI